MNKTIFKYELEATIHLQSIVMPKGAKILHFGNQRDQLTIWAEVDESEIVLETRLFQVLDTVVSQLLEERKLSYIGTALFHKSGVFVWHLYEALD